MCRHAVFGRTRERLVIHDGGAGSSSGNTAVQSAQELSMAWIARSHLFWLAVPAGSIPCWELGEAWEQGQEGTRCSLSLGYLNEATAFFRGAQATERHSLPPIITRTRQASAFFTCTQVPVANAAYVQVGAYSGKWLVFFNFSTVNVTWLTCKSCSFYTNWVRANFSIPPCLASFPGNLYLPRLHCGAVRSSKDACPLLPASPFRSLTHP